MIKLSVIVPVYNCESYIQECIESLCNQQIRGLQIICIDDNSTDNSFAIMQEMQGKYKGIEIYQNNVNQGLAATRNRGLTYAAGEYIMFVDADDYIAADMIAELINYADRIKADMVLFDMKMFSDDNFFLSINPDARIRKYRYNAASGIDMLCALINNGEMSGTATGSIYKRSYLEKQKIKFIEKGQHEDIPFSFNALLCAGKVGYFHKVVYYYRQRCNSILHSPDYEKLLIGLIDGYTRMQLVWSEYVEETKCAIEKQHCVKQYLEKVCGLIEDRYVSYLAEKNFDINIDVADKIQGFHFLEKEEINKYIANEEIAELKNAGNIVIYGAGYLAKKIFILLKKNDIKIEYFCVTSIADNPKKLFDISVIEYTKRLKMDYIILTVSEQGKKQILENTDFADSKVVTLLYNN